MRSHDLLRCACTAGAGSAALCCTLCARHEKPTHSASSSPHSFPNFVNWLSALQLSCCLDLVCLCRYDVLPLWQISEMQEFYVMALQPWRHYGACARVVGCILAAPRPCQHESRQPRRAVGRSHTGPARTIKGSPIPCACRPISNTSCCYHWCSASVLHPRRPLFCHRLGAEARGSSSSYGG